MKKEKREMKEKREKKIIELKIEKFVSNKNKKGRE